MFKKPENPNDDCVVYVTETAIKRIIKENDNLNSYRLYSNAKAYLRDRRGILRYSTSIETKPDNCYIIIDDSVVMNEDEYQAAKYYIEDMSEYYQVAQQPYLGEFKHASLNVRNATFIIREDRLQSSSYINILKKCFPQSFAIANNIWFAIMTDRNIKLPISILNENEYVKLSAEFETRSLSLDSYVADKPTVQMDDIIQKQPPLPQRSKPTIPRTVSDNTSIVDNVYNGTIAPAVHDIIIRPRTLALDSQVSCESIPLSSINSQHDSQHHGKSVSSIMLSRGEQAYAQKLTTILHKITTRTLTVHDVTNYQKLMTTIISLPRTGEFALNKDVLTLEQYVYRLLVLYDVE